MKTEHEYDGTVYYCVNCFLFFYFRSVREKNSFTHKVSCTRIHYAKFCENCGELYTYDSICSFKKGLEILKKEFYGIISLDCDDYMFLFPYLH